MATALATLPFMGATAGDGDVGLAATAGVAGRADDGLPGFASGLLTILYGGGALAGFAATFLAGFAIGLAGAAFFGASLAAGFAIFFAAAVGCGLTGFLAATFGACLALAAGVVFFTTGAGLRAALWAGALATGAFLAGAFFATALLAGLAAGFAAALPETGLRAAGFFADAGLAAGLRAGAAFLAVALLPARAAATLGLVVLTAFAFPAVFPFCALAAVELRVVFAISLHRFGRGGRVL